MRSSSAMSRRPSIYNLNRMSNSSCGLLRFSVDKAYTVNHGISSSSTQSSTVSSFCLPIRWPSPVASLLFQANRRLPSIIIARWVTLTGCSLTSLSNFASTAWPRTSPIRLEIPMSAPNTGVRFSV